MRPPLPCSLLFLGVLSGGRDRPLVRDSYPWWWKIRAGEPPALLTELYRFPRSGGLVGSRGGEAR